MFVVYTFGGDEEQLRVALLLMEKLSNANKYCLVCDDPINGYLPAVPIVCPKVIKDSSSMR